MAKKKKAKNNLENEEIEKSGSKAGVFLVVLLFVLIWIAILAFCIRWDVGGFGSGVLQPVLKDVPVLNKILPDTDDSSLVTDDKYPYTTLSDAISRIKELELELQKAQETSSTGENKTQELQTEVDRLKQFENNQAEFQQTKEKFYQEVIYNDKAPDIKEYKKYYEAIDPENAEQLYKQVVKDITYSEQVTEYASAYSSMKPAQAAGIIEAMTDNLDLAAEILEAMDSEARGKILGAMKPDVAAKLTKIMEPEQ